MSHRLVLAALLGFASASAFAAEPPRAPVPLQNIKQPAPAPALKVPVLLRPSVAVPNGSYLASCQNVRTEGDALKASCERKSGGRWETSISVSGCSGVDIFNRNGVLMCVTPVRARWGKTVLPPGSYVNSCFGYVEGMTLRAACLTGSGDVSILGLEVSNESTRQNRMDLTRCPDGSEIANLRGDLTCIAR
jgi:hypothetical protein